MAATLAIKTILLTLDTNADKVLSGAEYERGCDGCFARLDANRDGVLGRDEIMNLPVRLLFVGGAKAQGASAAEPLKVYQPKVTLADIYREAGLPDGALNIVTGFGERIGDALLDEQAHHTAGAGRREFPVGWINGVSGKGRIVCMRRYADGIEGLRDNWELSLSAR